MGKFVAKAPFWREIGSPCIEMRKYNHHHSFSSSSCVGRNEESVNDFYGVIFNNGRTSLLGVPSLGASINDVRKFLDF